MSNLYAQINEDGICVGLSQLHSEEVSPFLAAVDSLDITYIGRSYARAVLPKKKTPAEKLAIKSARDASLTSGGWSRNKK